MKRIYLARRNALFSAENFSWGAGALIVAVLLFLVRITAPNFFLFVFTPVFHSADTLTEASHTFLSSFNNSATLTIQNEKLVAENTALAAENQALREKADATVLTSSGIVARVIARPPTSPYDTLVLNVGSADDVTLSMEVFGAGGVPLGLVSSVLPHFSRVTLFSSPEVSLDGWVGETSIPLTLRGAGGGALTASIARSAGVTAGDTVYAPGPGKLPLGNVVRVDGDLSSPGVTLRIQLALNLFSLTTVELRDTGTAVVHAFTTASSSSL